MLPKASGTKATKRTIDRARYAKKRGVPDETLQKRGECAMCGARCETVLHRMIPDGALVDANALEVCEDCEAKIVARIIPGERVREARLTGGSYVLHSGRRHDPASDPCGH